MASFNISDVLSKKRLNPPMKSFLWRVILPDIINDVSIRFNDLAVGDGVDAAFELLESQDPQYYLEVSSRVANISIPIVTIDTEKAIDANTFWYYAKHNDIGTISMEIYEYEDSLTHRYFKAWQSLLVNSDGTYNPPAIYKKNIEFFRLSSTHEHLLKYKFNRYFISSITDQQNDYDSNDIVKWNITFTGDSLDTTILPISSLNAKPDEIELLSKSIEFRKKLDNLDTIVTNALN